MDCIGWLVVSEDASCGSILIVRFNLCGSIIIMTGSAQTKLI